MNSSFMIDSINLEWSIVYNSRGHRLKLQFSSLNIIFVLANRVDPDEMPHYAAFNLGILRLQL